MQQLIRHLAIILFPVGVLAAFYYPNPQVSFLEHILVDNWGSHASNFSSAITPCNNYVTEVGVPAVNSGRTTAAQWIRVAFHDFVTADISAGTGGLDASIGFETLRGENSGSAFNDSFTFWRPFVSDAVSNLIAMGTVMSMGLCGGHKVPYRPGRVDALEADPTTGVPAPETSLEETLLFFNRAGLNRSDAIGLTACGHTMGSVHHGGFPQVIPASTVTPNNTNGGMNFDATRSTFDSNVVHEYIDWTGNRGGPLVATNNVTTRSDLRLYESDGNATMQALYDMGDGGFEDACVELMGRMIDTVPARVSLQDVITPMAIKPINVTFDFDNAGRLFLSGNIRVLTTSGSAGHVQVALDSAGRADLGIITETLKPESGTGSSLYGETTYYPFYLPLDANMTCTSLRVSGSGFDTQVFPIQGEVFVVPSMTTIVGKVVNFTIAAKPGQFSSSASVSVVAPVGQERTLGPKTIRQLVDVDLAPNDIAGAAGYHLWQASINLALPATGAVSVNIVLESAVHDVLYLTAGVAGW